MLITLTTQLSRLKRRKGSFLVVPVTNIEQAAAAVRAAETQRIGIGLEVDATQPLLYSLEMWISMLLYIGRASTANVTVMARTGSSHLAVEQAVQAGAQTVVSEQRGSFAQYVSLVSWSSAFAAARGAELVAVWGTAAPGAKEFAERFRGIRLAAVDVPVGALTGRGKALAADHFHHLHRQFDHPLMVTVRHDHTPAQLRSLRAMGAAAIRVTGEFDETFTAGVRATLRNQMEGRPAWYLGKGGRAVEDKVVRYLQTLC